MTATTKVTSTERVRAWRAKQKAKGVTALHETDETSKAHSLSPAVVQTMVEEFTQLKEGLQVKLAEIESDHPAVELGRKVLSDSDLRFIVESMYLRSEVKREQLRQMVASYQSCLQRQRSRQDDDRKPSWQN